MDINNNTWKTKQISIGKAEERKTLLERMQYKVYIDFSDAYLDLSQQLKPTCKYLISKCNLGTLIIQLKSVDTMQVLASSPRATTSIST